MPRHFDHSIGLIVCDGSHSAVADNQQYSFKVTKGGAVKELLGWGVNEQVPEPNLNPPNGENVTTVWVEEDNAKTQKAVRDLAAKHQDRYGTVRVWEYPENADPARYWRASDQEIEAAAADYAATLSEGRQKVQEGLDEDARPQFDGEARDVRDVEMSPDDDDLARHRAQEDTTSESFAPDEDGHAFFAAQEWDVDDEDAVVVGPDGEEVPVTRSDDQPDPGHTARAKALEGSIPGNS